MSNRVAPRGVHPGHVASGVGEHIHLMLPYPFAHTSSYAFAGGGRRERVEERRGRKKVVFGRSSLFR